MAETNVADAVKKVCAAALPSAEARKVALTWAVPVEPGVRGEAFLLEQAVSNLVQNALDFTPPGGAVAVTLRAEANRVVVTVEDTGAGVPDYARGKIFDRFYSLPRPDTGRKSSGLGLSIVREIARLHGGEAALENRREGGARAVLTLPLA